MSTRSAYVQDGEDIGFNALNSPAHTSPVYSQLQTADKSGANTVYIINTGRNSQGEINPESKPSVAVYQAPSAKGPQSSPSYASNDLYGALPEDDTSSYDPNYGANRTYPDQQYQSYPPQTNNSVQQSRPPQYRASPHNSYPTNNTPNMYNNPPPNQYSTAAPKSGPGYSSILQGPSHLSEDELEKRYFVSRSFAEDPNLASTVEEALLQAKRNMARQEEEAMRNAVVMGPNGPIRGANNQYAGNGAGVARDTRVLTKADARLMNKDMSRAGYPVQQSSGYSPTSTKTNNNGYGGKSANMRNVGGYGGNGGVSGNVKKSHPYLRHQQPNGHQGNSTGNAHNNPAVALYTAHSMGIKPKRRARPSVPAAAARNDGYHEDYDGYDGQKYTYEDNQGYSNQYDHDGYTYHDQNEYGYQENPYQQQQYPLPDSHNVPGVGSVMGEDMVDAASANTYFDLIEKLNQQAKTQGGRNPGKSYTDQNGVTYQNSNMRPFEPMPAELAAPPPPDTTAVYQSMRPLPPPLMPRNDSGNSMSGQQNPGSRDSSPRRINAVTKNTPKHITHAYMSALPEPPSQSGNSVFNLSNNAVVHHVNPKPAVATAYPVEPSPLLHNPNSSLSLLNNPRKVQREIEISEKQKSERVAGSSDNRLRQAKEEEAARARERMWREQVGEIENGNTSVILNGSTLPGEMEERSRLAKTQSGGKPAKANVGSNSSGTSSGRQSRLGTYTSPSPTPGPAMNNSQGNASAAANANDAPPRYMQPKAQTKAIPSIPAPAEKKPQAKAIRGQKIVPAEPLERTEDNGNDGNSRDGSMQGRRDGFDNSRGSGLRKNVTINDGKNNSGNGGSNPGNAANNGGLRGDYSEYAYDDDEHHEDGMKEFGGMSNADRNRKLPEDTPDNSARGSGKANTNNNSNVQSSNQNSTQNEDAGDHMTDEELEKAALRAAEEAYRQAIAKRQGQRKVEDEKKPGAPESEAKDDYSADHDDFEDGDHGHDGDLNDHDDMYQSNPSSPTRNGNFSNSRDFDNNGSGRRTRTEPPTEAALRRERLLVVLREQKEWEKTHKQTIIQDRKQQHENVVAFIKTVDVNDKQAAVQEVKQQHVALKEVVKTIHEQHRQTALVRKQEMKREAMKAKLIREKEKERERREEKEKEEAKFEALLRVMAEEKAVVAREYERIRSLERERETDNLKRRFANERFLKGGHVPQEFVHIAGGTRAPRPTSTNRNSNRNSNSTGSLNNGHSPMKRGSSSRSATPMMEVPATLPALVLEGKRERDEKTNNNDNSQSNTGRDRATSVTTPTSSSARASSDNTAPTPAKPSPKANNDAASPPATVDSTPAHNSTDAAKQTPSPADNDASSQSDQHPPLPSRAPTLPSPNTSTTQPQPQPQSQSQSQPQSQPQPQTQPQSQSQPTEQKNSTAPDAPPAVKPAEPTPNASAATTTTEPVQQPAPKQDAGNQAADSQHAPAYGVSL